MVCGLSIRTGYYDGGQVYLPLDILRMHVCQKTENFPIGKHTPRTECQRSIKLPQRGYIRRYGVLVSYNMSEGVVI
jgi:hypothetical protein